MIDFLIEHFLNFGDVHEVLHDFLVIPVDRLDVGLVVDIVELVSELFFEFGSDVGEHILEEPLLVSVLCEYLAEH